MATVTQFNDEVGLSYLRGMHLNDSKATLGSHKDRHENIGLYVLSLPLSYPLLASFPLSFVELHI